ncbi:MAG: type II toxin-antitoxin system VapC family toxin [Coriobacteriia bacterium]
MNVVDSSAWLEYLGDGPCAPEFASPIENTADLVVPALTVYEVFKRTFQLTGETVALEAAALMLQGRVVDVSTALALDAARISLDEGLPMADSIILATARSESAVLWTQDAHFAGLDSVEYRAKQ